MIFGLFFLFLIQSCGNENDYQCLNNSENLKIPITIYRMTFIFIYIIFATGFCIQTFKKYKINYLMIFDLDPSMKMTHIQLYRISSFLFFLQNLFFTLTMIQIKYYKQYNLSNKLWIPLLFVVIQIAYFTQFIFQFGYRQARKQLCYTLVQIVLSPFGRVKFRDFFLADVITSMVQSLNDIAFTIYFFYPSNFTHNKSPDQLSYTIIGYILGIIPFWFRLQ